MPAHKMRINGMEYVFDPVEQVNRPTLYPGESSDDWEIPQVYSDVFTRLNSIIETKYSKEYLKICAFYNKMFPSLNCSDWNRVSYIASAFTRMEQEHTDTGTGICNNYLKQIVDQITSRLGTLKFVPYLLSEDQSYEYILYKDEVERILRMYITKDGFSNKCTDCFHDAALLCFSYAFMNPFTDSLVKANDYEIGIYESQLNQGKIRQMLYRNYAFPVTELYPYLKHMTEERQEEIADDVKDMTSVDFCMFFDCTEHKCVVSINGKFLDPVDYLFDTVLVAVMRWDAGFCASTTTSLFDLLYPLQREINKISAKQQQLIRNYKGATPVFCADVELAMKAISNGTGECMYVDSNRPLDTLMTVINPTPLDPELSGVINEFKSAMYEIAGIQNASFDMNNMRSAAAVVALDQTRDSVFQAQLQNYSDFITSVLKLYIDYNAVTKGEDGDRVDWTAVKKLIDTAYISLKPVHINDPLSDEDKSRQEPIDYQQLCTAKIVLKVIKGEIDFSTVPYFVDWRQVAMMLAVTMVKFEALGIDVPDTVHKFLIAAFVESIKIGAVQI